MSIVPVVPQGAVLGETLAELLDDGLFIDGDWIESKDQDPNGEVRLIQLADVGDGAFRDRSSRFLTMSKAKELRCTFLQPGDVLVARMPEPLGRACVFPGVGQPAVTAVDVCILRPNPARVRVEWLVKAINSPEFRSAMQEFVRGTTRQRISRKNLGTLRLNVPSTEEQLDLSNLVDSVDRKRSDAAHHVIEARKAIGRVRHAILAAARSGRLSPEASEWKTVPAASLFEWSSGKTLTKKNQRAGPIPVFGGNGIQGWHERALIQAPTFVVGRVGALCGNVYLTSGPAWVTDNAIYAKTINEEVTPAWAALVFEAASLNSISAGSSQPFVNQKMLNDVEVPLPPRKQQHELIRRVDQLLALADRLGQRIEVAASCIDLSSQAVLARAFRGELTVNGANGSAGEVASPVGEASK